MTYSINVTSAGFYLVNSDGKPVQGPFAKREQALFALDRYMAASAGR